MQRRSFFQTIFAPLLAKFAPRLVAGPQAEAFKEFDKAFRLAQIAVDDMAKRPITLFHEINGPQA